ncbi:MAG: PBP1A family penicillin-binding protein [Candidatus Korobacteraceae bacterium]
MTDPIIRTAVAAFIILGMVIFGVFAFYHVKYERIIDRRLSGSIFNTSAKIFGRAEIVRAGDHVGIAEVASQLRGAGYREQEDGSSGMGWFRVSPVSLEIHPGEQSYHNPDGALIHFHGQSVDRIEGIGANAGQSIAGYELEPKLLTQLFEGEQRTKRQLVKFNDIPKGLVDAVVAIEDRRFFQHGGVNYWRLVKAALIDLRAGGEKQGGSTITMQLSRGFFLTPEKRIKRKLIEILIALELEQKLTKQQIFELYANQVDLGQRGSFTISGFGEAARAYFGKDVKDLTLAEAAMLAGLIQRPSYLSPYRHPERALERRNLVLESMVDTGAITRAQADKAKATPLNLAAMNVESSDAPYFVDLVKDTVQNSLGEDDLNEKGYRIYTTLDPELQHAAAEAVSTGMKLVDEQVKKQRTKRVKVGTGSSAHFETHELPGPVPQVALVAIDPHTGEVLALVGGRNYGFSQLNHAVAKRPTGSIFKPFVYAAAVNTALTGSPDKAFTPATLIDDSPTTFSYGDQIYEPRNYKNEYHGQVTARFALAESLNNATVKLAEMVGYDNVAELARTAGISSVRATPAMALGAYDATPLDMAGAYTIFANSGVRVSPEMIKSVRARNGDMVQDYNADSRPVLDPRVAYVMTSMMESVMNNGTAYTVRARGFTAPAAGKTGTSHDAWFAGYTTNLLCIVWVGYDDYSDLKLAGAATAAPIWAEFMKSAVKLQQYKDAGRFQPPSGVVDVRLDKVTNLLSTSSCPAGYDVAFIAGTEPTLTCDQGNGRNFLQRIFGLGQPNTTPPTTNGPARVVPPSGRAQGPSTPPVTQPPASASQPEKRKGFFGKVFGIFKGDDDKDSAENGSQRNPKPKPPGNN